MAIAEHSYAQTAPIMPGWTLARPLGIEYRCNPCRYSPREVMNIAIIGTGYVGLVSGTCFAEMGCDVICVDVDREKVRSLKQGVLPIYEPDLEASFRRNLREERLSFTSSLQEALEHAEIIFLALPTPPGADGAADLSIVLAVARQVADFLGGSRTYRIIVNKSTVPVGTAEQVAGILAGEGLVAGRDFDVVSNPEFLREGAAVGDFMKPERIVLGTSSTRAAEGMRRLYEPFVRQGNPIHLMDARSAEVTKYAANAYLATRISFMNEIAILCERVGANVDQVRLGIGSDSRIGKQFLYAGIGFGGSCFPKDVRALVYTAQQHGYDFRILSAVLEVNAAQRSVLAGRVRDYFEGTLEGRNIAVWGLSFKPNTDDVREAPAHVVVRGLLEAGARVTAFDPEAIRTTRAVLGEAIRYAATAYEALAGADALVICTEWPEFRRPNLEKVHGLLRHAVIFDGRNLYDPDRMARAGFQYFSIGRPYVAPGARQD